MAMELIGVAGMTPELKQTYERRLLERALPVFLHNRWGEKRPVPRGGGKSIEFRRFERITTSTTALTEGTPPSETQGTFSTVAVTVSQYGQFSRLSDVLQMQAFDPIIAEYTDNYGEAMGDALDQVTRDVLVAGTTVQYASTATSRATVGSGMYLNDTEVRKAVKTLDRNNAKPVEDGRYVMILHPDTQYDFFADSTVRNVFLYAHERGQSNPLFSGILGDYYKCRTYSTTNAKIFSSAGLSGADVYATMVFGKGYYGISEFGAESASVIAKAKGSAGTSDPLNQVSTVGWKASHGAVRLNENYAVRVEHVTSQKNAA